ncbi:hypothetical protein SASPL_115645 [Salvia splendens]|uniref:Myb/SANT-like domain-containing protein n=1 Tax=Salvia splendens TaxID=180675 RepID=A0A8X9A1T9_SALSN|nr:hypothetical protein SASPL_115645 [Salvia splendens]
MYIPPQTEYLYQGQWSVVCDTILIDCLERMKGHIYWDMPLFPSWITLSAAAKLKNSVGVVFSEAELDERVEILRKRYKTFKALVGTNGFRWDQPTKQIIASDEMWEKLISKNEFAGAYYHHDEPMFSQLAYIFGMNDVKVEGANEVVVISDNTQKVSTEVLEVYEAGVVEDEVTSPMVIPRPPVCRKLFDDGADVTDRESTTKKGMYFIDIGSDGMLGTRFEKGVALPKPPPIVHPEAGPSGRSPHGSSCASNSPITWWPHNFRRPPF